MGRPLSDVVRNTLTELGDLLLRKNADYGSTNILELGPRGVVSRVNDKIRRLDNLLSHGGDSMNESVEDTWKDIMGYGLIGLLLHRGQWPGQGAVDDNSRSASTVMTPRRVEPTAGNKIQLVYLAGPVDIGDDGVSSWRTQMSEMLAKLGVSTYSPERAFTWASGIVGADCLFKINQAALANCGAMVAYLPKGVPTIGTPREIQWAVDSGKPVVVVYPSNNDVATPLYLWDTVVVSSTQEAVEYLTRK